MVLKVLPILGPSKRMTARDHHNCHEGKDDSVLDQTLAFFLWSE